MIQNPHRDFPIAKDSLIAEDRFLGWIQSVTDALNALDITTGNGDPNGSVFAAQKKMFFDSAGNALYFKTTPENVNTGWVQLT